MDKMMTDRMRARPVDDAWLDDWFNRHWGNRPRDREAEAALKELKATLREHPGLVK